MKPVRIVLADDHGLVRAGLRALLLNSADFAVVGEAADGREALRLIEELDPDIALMDISMPHLNGLEAAARVAKKFSRTRVIILSMHADEEYVRRALACGASAYLLKNASEGELELAVRAVVRGDSWLSPGISRPVLAAYASGEGGSRGPFERLTPRQREVLQLIAEGHSTKDIASHLDLSVKTIETHRVQIMKRLMVHDVTGLVRYAIRVGIVQAER
ncbi:MAG TPA: response regulator transcription factor [Polyangiaceae bacterium]|nr:response regulator transcription factor [Polyangiaceae bacterium]